MKRIQESLISVVVPAYNVEAYVERCIHSLCAQSYANIEILLAYAASPDRTETICEKLAAEDSRIIIVRPEGSGVSAARNQALEAAKGEYIAFVDADDYIDVDYLQTLYHDIQGREISICGFDRVKEEEARDELLGQDSEYDRDKLVIDVLCDNRVGGYLWNKLFRADIIREQRIRFRTDLSVGEDMEFLTTYLKYITKGYYRNAALYHYYLNENSALQKMYTTGVFEEKKLSNMQASRYIAEKLEHDSGPVQEAVSYRMVRTGMWTVFNLLKCNHYDKAVLKDIKKNMRGNFLAYCRNGNTRFVEKIGAAGIYVSPCAFWRLARLAMNLIPSEALQGYVS